jgi:hypothetical protein
MQSAGKMRSQPVHLRYPDPMKSIGDHCPETIRAYAGLCVDCTYGRKIESDRGSMFYLCERSSTDPAFAKYPRLPVLKCSGYAAKNEPFAEG